MRQVIVALVGFSLIVMPLASCADNEARPQVSQEELDTSIVLAYGYGIPSTGYPPNPFIYLAIPEIVVYKNGLVLFACREETWPQICQNHVSLKRSNDLLDNVSAVGFFHLSQAVYPGTTGPHGNLTIMARTAEMSGEVSFGTNAFFGADQQAIFSVQELLDEFYNEVRIDQRLYQPQSVLLGVSLTCDCRVMEGDCNSCKYLDSWTNWPFEFDPPYQTMAVSKCERYVEMLQPISVITSALPDLEENPDWYYGFRFRDGDILLSVKIRPYLPGETVRCSEDHWNGDYPDYTTLQFCSPLKDSSTH